MTPVAVLLGWSTFLIVDFGFGLLGVWSVLANSALARPLTGGTWGRDFCACGPKTQVAFGIIRACEWLCPSKQALIIAWPEGVTWSEEGGGRFARNCVHWRWYCIFGEDNGKMLWGSYQSLRCRDVMLNIRASEGSVFAAFRLRVPLNIVFCRCSMCRSVVLG